MKGKHAGEIDRKPVSYKDGREMQDSLRETLYFCDAQAYQQTGSGAPEEYEAVAYPIGRDDREDNTVEGYGQQQHGKPAFTRSQRKTALLLPVGCGMGDLLLRARRSKCGPGYCDRTLGLYIGSILPRG